MRLSRRVLAAAAVLGTVSSFAGFVPAQATDLGLGSPLVGGGACSGSSIAGTGSSFQNNAIQNWIATFPCGPKVTYTKPGSGAGLAAFAARTTDFGGTDLPLRVDAQLVDTAGGGTNASLVNTIPVAVGAVTVPVNLAACGIGSEQITLSSTDLSNIFSGLVTNWSDPLLSTTNANLAGCNLAIRLVVRDAVSGTTFIFKDYLSKRNPVWFAFKQPEENTSWPAGVSGLNPPITAAGNGGVLNTVLATSGAIGYADLSDAKAKGAAWALVGDGPVAQSPMAGDGSSNCALAAQAGAVPLSTLLPGWDTVSITDTPGSYGACGFTYDLLYNEVGSAYQGVGNVDTGRARTLADFFGYVLSDAGQSQLAALGYAPLPVNVQIEAQLGLVSLTDH
jgi:phosphate transport system substrate-binding protein